MPLPGSGVDPLVVLRVDEGVDGVDLVGGLLHLRRLLRSMRATSAACDRMAYIALDEDEGLTSTAPEMAGAAA
jgi:hypothetical protein